MSFVNRAWLYIIRKKGKSILLFIILFLIAMFVLSAIAIGNASKLAQENLRKSLGGEFSIAYDYTEENPYLKIEPVDGGTIVYSTQQITSNLIEEIKKIEGIQYCSATIESLSSFPTIDLFAGTIPIEEEFRQSTKILGVWKSEENKHFTSGQIKLVEGRHITPQDDKKVIISKDLADRNKLKIGDVFKTSNNIDAQIVGLFQQSHIEEFNEQVTTYDKIQNLIISDLSMLVALENSPAVQGFNELGITVSDPQNMKKIISQVKDIKNIDWKGFTLTENNENYDNATDPLQQITSLVSIFLISILVVSVIILSLILTMWARTRIHETGVLLSIGISKMSIIGQYMIEVIIIAVIAFSLSYFPSHVFANQVGNFLQSNSEKIEEKESGDRLETGNRNDTSSENENEKITTPSLNIQVQIEEMSLLFILGIGIVVISVGISSVSTMRLKPREILSKMS